MSDWNAFSARLPKFAVAMTETIALLPNDTAAPPADDASGAVRLTVVPLWV
jgi:hypothetical protein